jgi:hypothetical protein
MINTKDVRTILLLITLAPYLMSCSKANVQNAKSIVSPSLPIESSRDLRVLSPRDLDHIIDARLSRKDTADFLTNVKIQEFERPDPDTNWTDAKLSGPDDRFSIYYLTYRKTHFILLLVDSKEEISNCVDILVLPQRSPNYDIGMGGVEIDGDQIDGNVVVIYNKNWKGNYSDDIIAAYWPNLVTEQFDEVKYKSIRIYRDQP